MVTKYGLTVVDKPKDLNVSPISLPPKDYSALENKVRDMGVIMAGAQGYVGNGSTIIYVRPKGSETYVHHKRMNRISKELAQQFPKYSPFMVLDGSADEE